MGLLAIIHNHPSNNPLHSQGDVNGVDFYDIKYSFIFTEETGLLALKIDENNFSDVIKGYADFYQTMFEDFKTNNIKEYNNILDLAQFGRMGSKIYKKKLNNAVKEHISKNLSKSINVFKGSMSKNNVSYIHIKP